MTPWYAKFIATGIGILCVVLAQYYPGAATALAVLGGIAGGKEFFPRTGDVPVSLLNEKR